MIKRHKTIPVKVGNIYIGGNYPVCIQSMTDIKTADISNTVQQIIDLHLAGSELVRITVNDEEAAKAVIFIKESLIKQGFDIPLVGCFHYNGHSLLTNVPSCAEALDKYRINPGNVGFGEKRDKQFDIMIDTALKYNKPVRIGVNWGSLDQDLAKKFMDENNALSKPQSATDVMHDTLVQSALLSAKRAEELGLTTDKIIVSCKVSRVQDLIIVYRKLAERSNYALHLGLTEAGMGSKSIVATTAALSILLQEGIGDTIRSSLTPEPNGLRSNEVTICREILQAMGLRYFTPQVSACPGCGRTTSNYFKELANDIQSYIKVRMIYWKTQYPGVENLNIAVMGCIVNGPGESKHADIGISLPGSGESPIAPVFIDGNKSHTLRGDKIAQDFKNILEQYVQKRFSML